MVVAVNQSSHIIRGMMNNTVTVELPRAEKSEDSTGGRVGYCIGHLLNLKQMMHINSGHGGEGVFSQSEMLQQIDKVIDKLDQITYPYAV